MYVTDDWAKARGSGTLQKLMSLVVPPQPGEDLVVAGNVDYLPHNRKQQGEVLQTWLYLYQVLHTMRLESGPQRSDERRKKSPAGCAGLKLHR
jgi:hypothetical protein